jgi:Lar family restriction alleviation protein
VSELKPCPFCGGEAVRTPQFCMGYMGDGVKCKRCGIQTAPLQTDAEAIAAWNRRAEKGEG